MNSNSKKNEVLHNPGVDEFTQEDKQFEKYETQAEGQTSFRTGSVTSTPRQYFTTLKYRLKRHNEEINVAQVWKSIAIPFAIVSWLFIVVILVFGGIFSFSSLPPTIPLIYDSANNRWEQVDKSVVFIFAFFIGVAEFLALQFLVKIFNSDRRLALTFAWMIVFLNIMLLIAIGQIYSLIR